MTNEQIFESVRALCEAAQNGAPTLALKTGEERNAALLAIAGELRAASAEILAANRADLDAAEQNGVPRVMLDRLTLTKARLDAIAAAVEGLTALPDPLNRESAWERPADLSIRRLTVPLGVVAIIYEARPNVTADAAALCVKSGNAVILRGGKEAINTNRAIVRVIKSALAACGISPDTVGLIEVTDRESANALMQMRGLVDVLIPRGGKGLIRNCVDNARIPVIETGAGNCHVYVDEQADLDMALRIAVNAKCQRPSVCNAAECLLVHERVAADFLPAFYRATREWDVAFRACEASLPYLPGATLATDEDYATEYNDYVMNVKVVSSLDGACAHIARFGTRHSEAIVTENEDAAARFTALVDAAAVYHNASTRFTDGEVYGFGAEIGISTQKLHARGPMGLEALTTVKYAVRGKGSIR